MSLRIILADDHKIMRPKSLLVKRRSQVTGALRREASRAGRTGLLRPDALNCQCGVARPLRALKSDTRVGSVGR